MTLKWTSPRDNEYMTEVAGLFRLSVFKMNNFWHASLLDTQLRAYVFQQRPVSEDVELSAQRARAVACTMASRAVAQRIEDHGKALARFKR